jgi:hypothetical protein
VGRRVEFRRGKGYAQKKSPGEPGDHYMDGLVSTGKINSLYNIIYNLFNTKKNSIKIINIS